ncbi:MAG: hypothetical protein R2818_10310 [Flavobacteriales bacterium]
MFSAVFDAVDFNANRYCNAYGLCLYKDNKMEYHRCYRLPNNKLRIYGKEEAHGRIALVPGKDHHIRFKVTDANGNGSGLRSCYVGPRRKDRWHGDRPSQQEASSVTTPRTY